MIQTNSPGVLVICNAGAAADHFQFTTDAAGNAFTLPRGRYRLIISCDAGAPIFYVLKAGAVPVSASPKTATGWREAFSGPTATLQQGCEFDHLDKGIQLAYGFLDPTGNAQLVLAVFTLVAVI